MCQKAMGAKTRVSGKDVFIEATLVMEFGNSRTYTVSGWITSFNADINAPEGNVEAKVSVHFLASGPGTYATS